jgi:hypothetical protein
MSKVYSDAFIGQALVKVYSRGKRTVRKRDVSAVIDFSAVR